MTPDAFGGAPPPAAGAEPVDPSAGAAAVADAAAKAIAAAAAQLPDAFAAARSLSLTFADSGDVTVDVDGQSATIAAADLGMPPADPGAEPADPGGA